MHLSRFLLLCFAALVSATVVLARPSGLRTVGGAHPIDRIHLVGVYYLPPGRQPLPDWKERLAYFLDRAAKFHHRELAGQSRVAWEIRPEPYVPVPEPGRPKDANDWFWRVANEVRARAWTRQPEKGFPLILIFTDTNFCPGYDDWRRVCDPAACICPDHPRGCPGHVTASGEERPGSACGGSRAVYWPSESLGIGVISGDGWRVPVKGSDCVAYHEGIGHAIGLPHPEPMNDTVMGRAQYTSSLNRTTLDPAQKKTLGWEPVPPVAADLFSGFDTGYTPRAPTVGQPVTLTATVPSASRPRSLKAEYQTRFGPWTRLGPPRLDETPDSGESIRYEWTLPPFDRPVFVSYRIFVDGAAGEREQQWDLFRVRERR